MKKIALSLALAACIAGANELGFINSAVVSNSNELIQSRTSNLRGGADKYGTFVSMQAYKINARSHKKKVENGELTSYDNLAKLRGWNFIVGANIAQDGSLGSEWHAGLFANGGYGFGSIKSQHVGGGVFAKFYSGDTFIASVINAGRVNSEITDYNKAEANQIYVGGSSLFGREFWGITDNGVLTLQGGVRYFYLGAESMPNVRMMAQHSFKANALASWNEQISQKWQAVLTLGYEFEFCDDMRSVDETTRTYYDEFSARGGTGIGGLAVVFEPTKHVKIELGGKYYVGQREGFSANFNLKGSF